MFNSPSSQKSHAECNMSSSQALYPEYTLYHQWTDWSSPGPEEHSRRLVEVQGSHKVIRTHSSPLRQTISHPTRNGSLRPSAIQPIGNQDHLRSPPAPTRSMSWPSSVCPSSNPGSESTWATTPPSEPVRTTNATQCDALAPYFPLLSANGPHGGIELQPQNFDQSTEWQILRAAPQPAQTVYAILPHSNPTNCSFSPPPSSPSRPVSTVKQEEGSNRSTKPIYGLFPDFGAWQSGDQQVYYDHPSTGATPSQSPSYIEPVNTKKRRRSDSEPEHVVNKRFRCEFCGFAFDRKCNLTCHLKVHDVGRREVHCPRPGCDKKYGRRADANRHVRTFHNKDQHTCNHCGKSFVRTDILTRHIADACPVRRAQKNALPTPPTGSPYPPNLPPLQ